MSMGDVYLQETAKIWQDDEWLKYLREAMKTYYDIPDILLNSRNRHFVGNEQILIY